VTADEHREATRAAVCGFLEREPPKEHPRRWPKRYAKAEAKPEPHPKQLSFFEDTQP
jgi:hypothetical protein